MEQIFQVVPTRWGHESSKGRQITNPPTEEDIAGGQWEPEFVEVDIDTIVILEENRPDIVFKFMFDKSALAAFIGNFVEHLDVDGRKHVRDALDLAGGVVIPEIEVPSSATLKLIPGGQQ